MGNYVKKTYTAATSWTAPAGVTKIILTGLFNRISNRVSGASMVTPDFDAYMWGQNSVGNLGNGTFGVSTPTPTKVVGGYKIQSIYAGQNNGFGAYALTVDGYAYAWGDGSATGGLGNGSLSIVSSPVAVSGGRRFKQLAPLGGGCIALDFNGQAWAWGGNQWGQLGVGDVVSRSTPVAVLGGLVFAQIFSAGDPSGGATAYGMTAAGQIYGWGINVKGSIGDGTAVSKSSPVAVVGGQSFVAMATANFNSGPSCVALDANGVAWSWGGGEQGLLGNGTQGVGRSSPVAVSGGLTFASVGNGYGCLFGIQSDGTAYSWGFNGDGQLGVGDVVSRSTPVAVLGGVKFIEIKGGTTCPMSGIAKDGTVYTWGGGNVSGMGDGTTVSKSSPVAIAGNVVGDPIQLRSRGTSFVSVTPGTTYTIAFTNNFAVFNGVPLVYGCNAMSIEYFV